MRHFEKECVFSPWHFSTKTPSLPLSHYHNSALRHYWSNTNSQSSEPYNDGRTQQPIRITISIIVIVSWSWSASRQSRHFQNSEPTGKQRRLREATRQRQEKGQNRREHGRSQAPGLQRSPNEKLGKMGIWNPSTQKKIPHLAGNLPHPRNGSPCARRRCAHHQRRLSRPQLPPTYRIASSSRFLLPGWHSEGGHRSCFHDQLRLPVIFVVVVLVLDVCGAVKFGWLIGIRRTGWDSRVAKHRRELRVQLDWVKCRVVPDWWLVRWVLGLFSTRFLYRNDNFWSCFGCRWRINY